MTRHPRARRPRARIAVLAAALLASGIGAAPSVSASPIVGIDQLDIDPDWRAVPRGEIVTAVSAGGYAHATEDGDHFNGDRLVWTDFATGTSVPLGYEAHPRFAEAGIGGRYVYVEPALGEYAVRDLATGVQKPFTPPSDASYVGLLGGSLLFQRNTGFFLVQAADLAGPQTPVAGWPADAELSTAQLVAGDGTVAVIRYARQGSAYDYTGLGLVELATGRVTAIEDASTPYSSDSTGPVVLGPDRIAWVDRSRTVHVRDRALPTAAAEQTFALPADLDATGRIGLAGDWVLALTKPGGADPVLRRKLVAVHPDGRTLTLLEKAQAELNQVTGQDTAAAAVVGGTGPADWALQKVVPGKDGTPLLEKLAAPVEPVAATVESIALGAGRLSSLEWGGSRGSGFFERTLPVGPLHTGQSKPVPLGAEQKRLERNNPLFASGDGRTVHLAHEDFKPLEVVARTASGRVTRALTGENHGQLADVFGRWAVFQGGSGQTLVLNLDAPAGTSPVVRKQTRTAAAVWGDTLFTGTAVNGEVARTDLTTGKATGTFSTGAGCPATEFQVSAGRWLYWACGQTGAHGVHDLRTGARLALGQGVAGGGLLGDGFYVSRDAASYLRVTDFHTGTARTRTLVDATPVSGPRRETWTVDRFGGAVAYRGADQRVHAVWTGVPASDLTAASASAPASARSKDGWKASWTLSKPASMWRLNIRDPHTGTVVRSYGGGETRGRIDIAWDGRTAAGRTAPNGPYVWDLTANTADGQGRDLALSGGLTVTGGTPGRRDLAGNDRQGDLLVMDTAGLVSMYRGNAYGGLSARIAGTGARFPTTSVLVPFGDVNADGCADVLARVGDQLRSYRPGCGKVVSASSPYTALGSGWGGFDVLTSPGDLNGDGFTDLIARQASNGDLYLYGGTADHRLKPRVRIGTGWKLYTKLIGAGDLNRDGRDDLLGIDTAGVLWRYYGTATGGLSPRVKLGGGWNGYSALVGLGDLSGDGVTDLVARDTAGRLYSYEGTGAGAYGGRVLIGTGGWNGFKGLF
ncbi:FG-GAP-like repeat-containing protein [Streptomyces sp. NPDC058855]|uniref:FG-GAP-like repeat-containing protein n=1 Tax=Streptomyces sp. NPDC058855 TaxID=3346651 RepID=UPI0036982B27